MVTPIVLMFVEALCIGVMAIFWAAGKASRRPELAGTLGVRGLLISVVGTFFVGCVISFLLTRTFCYWKVSFWIGVLSGIFYLFAGGGDVMADGCSWGNFLVKNYYPGGMANRMSLPRNVSSQRVHVKGTVGTSQDFPVDVGEGTSKEDVEVCPSCGKSTRELSGTGHCLGCGRDIIAWREAKARSH